MKRLVATILLSLGCASSHLTGYSLEINTSYDYFRGIPDGSWNGNNGVVVGINNGFDCCWFDLQIGGSYGSYNWAGRGNVVFRETNRVEQIGFVTAGASSSIYNWNIGLVYDRMFTDHFSIYDLCPSIDQLRFKTGYTLCGDELGLWGTYDLARSHKHALGTPVHFKAIGQLNLFWTHRLGNCAQFTIWGGLPYRTSYRFPGGKAGNFIAGFAIKAPLSQNFALEGYGSYMSARNSHGQQNRNYGANIAVGITYSLDGCDCDNSPYMTIANHSNFFVDSNVNQ